MTDVQRVLFAYRGDVDAGGGAAGVMRSTAAALQALGVGCEISFELEPDPSGFDVVHVINAWAPGTAVQQLRHLAGTGVPVVFQPFFLGWSEMTWAQATLPSVLDPARPAAEREQLLGAFTAGTLAAGPLTQRGHNEIEPGSDAAFAEMMGLADHLVVCSAHEAQLIARTVGLQGTPFTHTPHGVDAERFAQADPAAFRALLGDDEPFLLCVGAVDHRKNQLMLAEAARRAGLRVVLLGPAFEPAIVDRALAVGGGFVRHLPRVDPAAVAAAYHAAAAHVLPSWAEGAALANLEAAAAGCPIVVSDRSSEFEYFGGLARYVDPADPDAIAAAMAGAAGDREAEPARLAELQARVRELTWQRTAEATLRAYRAAVAARRGAAPARPAARRAVSPALRAFTDALPWTRRPILEAVQRAARETPEGARVLDVGAGEAPYRELFDHTHYRTSDWEHSVHAGARAADVIGPAHDLPLPDGDADLVLLTEVLEHVAEPLGVLRELHRLLAPGGRLVLTVPFVWPLHELPHDFFRYTSWGLHHLLTVAGFVRVGVDPRNDAFSTIAQLLDDQQVIVGGFPDGRDAERAEAFGEGGRLAHQVVRHRALDLRGDLPLGWSATARKPPVAERERGPAPAGTRGFVVLADVRDVLQDAALLRAYAEVVGAGDDATLLLHGPPADLGALEAALTQVVDAVGPTGGDPDLLLAEPGVALETLGQGADAVLSRRPPTWALADLPHVHTATVGELRGLMGS